MSQNQACSIIPPRREQIVGYTRDANFLAPCVRGVGHSGPHVIRTPENKLIAWEDDMTCGCCGPTEDDRCVNYWHISEGDLEDLIRNRA